MKSLTGKEIIVRKSEITAFLDDAVKHHFECEDARKSVEDFQQLALWHGWNAGNRLNKIKPNIPNGDWLNWIEFNFCNSVKCSIRTAQIYMKIDNDHAHLRHDLETQRVAQALPDYELLKRLEFDTIRKYNLGFVPEKSQPEHEGNLKFERSTSFLNIMNEFERLLSRHVDDLELIEIEEVRRQTPRLYRFLKCVHETPELNPFAVIVAQNSPA